MPGEGAGAGGNSYAVITRTSVSVGQTRAATSLTAASLHGDPSTARRTLMIAPSFDPDFLSASVHPLPLKYLARMFPARLAKSSGWFLRSLSCFSVPQRWAPAYVLAVAPPAPDRALVAGRGLHSSRTK